MILNLNVKKVFKGLIYNFEKSIINNNNLALYYIILLLFNINSFNNYFVLIIFKILLINYNKLFNSFFVINNNIIIKKIILINRFIKATKRGKENWYKSVVIIGSKEKWIGLGVGKSKDLGMSIDKAVFNSYNNIYIFKY